VHSSIGAGSVNDLPKPQGWNTRVRRYGSILVITGSGGAYFVYKTVRAAEHTHWLASAVTAAAAVAFLVPAVSIGLSLAGRGRLRASFDATGTTLLVAAVARWLGVWFASVSVGTVLYLLFGSHMHDDLPDVRFRSIGWLGAVLVGGVLGLGLVIRASRRERPALRLCADGVILHDAVVRYTVSWDEIRDITGVVPQGKSLRPIVFERGDGAPAVVGNAALYAPGGVALFWMIRHYWRHPHERAELANGVAIERLRAGRFRAE
jgi:hypothetical protein